MDFFWMVPFRHVVEGWDGRKQCGCIVPEAGDLVEFKRGRVPGGVVVSSGGCHSGHLVTVRAPSGMTASGVALESVARFRSPLRRDPDTGLHTF